MGCLPDRAGGDHPGTKRVRRRSGAGFAHWPTAAAVHAERRRKRLPFRLGSTYAPSRNPSPDQKNRTKLNVQSMHELSRSGVTGEFERTVSLVELASVTIVNADPTRSRIEGARFNRTPPSCGRRVAHSPAARPVDGAEVTPSCSCCLQFGGGIAARANSKWPIRYFEVAACRPSRGPEPNALEHCQLDSIDHHRGDAVDDQAHRVRVEMSMGSALRGGQQAPASTTRGRLSSRRGRA